MITTVVYAGPVPASSPLAAATATRGALKTKRRAETACIPDGTKTLILCDPDLTPEELEPILGKLLVSSNRWTAV